MENKNLYQAQIFSNRIQKKYKELRKWARKNRITCYRLYDRDIPEIPLSLDMYEFLPDDIDSKIDAARFLAEQNARYSANDPLVEKENSLRRFFILYLYERPYEKDENDEEHWLDLMSKTVSEVFNVPVSHILRKERRKQKGESQYEKSTETSIVKGRVQEQGQLFNVDLSSYIDTGLFFDHRPLRAVVRNSSSGKAVLNLFCYTGSFSVYAAEGNAKSVESVDLSNTYLNWAKENMTLNGFSDSKKYIFTKGDVIKFLQEKKQANDTKYDLIILDPPTFSNSKMSLNMLDINKQWSELVNDCLNLLNPKGVLYFSTNSRRLIFDSTLVLKQLGNSNVNISDITEETIPQDFKGTKIHRCWKIQLD